jgi:hypothetical protein
MATMSWKPSWWKEDMHGNAWERMREAMRRDWEQTKKDLHMKGGHELNQNAKDTVKQMAGKEPIPMDDGAIRPKVIGDWDDVELPVGYGYAARQQYGQQYGTWNAELEGKLQSEWEAGKSTTKRGWSDVKDFVRHGFEYRGHDRGSRSSVV